MVVSKHTITAQIPFDLAVAIDELAKELDRLTSGLVKEGLIGLLERRELRHQAILAGLADVDAGRVISHADVVNFVDRIKHSN